MDVREIDGPVLQRVVSSLKLAASTMRVVLGVARQILRWGHRHGRIRVLRDLSVKLPSIVRAKVDPLTRAEVLRLLDNSFEWRPLLMWAIYTGMRQGEIIAAKWQHLEAGVYHVREAVNRRGELTRTKTNDGGSCWVPAGLLRALEDQRAYNSHRELATDDWIDHGFIFPGPHGGAYSHTPLIRAFQRACESADLRQRPFHHLRHTCASLLIDQGETIPTVQHQLRHANPSITLDTYTHLMPDAGAAALQRLDEAIGA
jgi:integrase